MGVKKDLNSEILKNWLNTVPPVDKNRVLSSIYSECLITPATLRNWRYGKCRIPLAGRRDLNKVSMSYSGYELYKIVPPESVAEA